MRPFIRTRFLNAVPLWACDHVRGLVAAIPRISAVRHRVYLTVVRSQAIKDENGNIFFGRFQATLSGACYIEICTGPKIGAKPRQRREFTEIGLTGFLTHEWAHYEQYRDLGKTTERGVQVRARTLERMVMNVQAENR